MAAAQEEPLSVEEGEVVALVEPQWALPQQTLRQVLRVGLLSLLVALPRQTPPLMQGVEVELDLRRQVLEDRVSLVAVLVVRVVTQQTLVLQEVVRFCLQQAEEVVAASTRHLPAPLN